jgi:hypothetical protein
MYGGSGGYGSGSATVNYFYPGIYAGAQAGGTNQTIQIMDYSATDKHKTILGRGNADGAYTIATANRWANTSAVTSVTLYAAGDAWASGTTVSIYGIAS